MITLHLNLIDFHSSKIRKCYLLNKRSIEFLLLMIRITANHLYIKYR